MRPEAVAAAKATQPTGSDHMNSRRESPLSSSLGAAAGVGAAGGGAGDAAGGGDAPAGHETSLASHKKASPGRDVNERKAGRHWGVSRFAAEAGPSPRNT